MPQSKLLVDSNAYLRLAQSIRPLLAREFGGAPFCLYCIPELNKELQGAKLRNTFSWTQEAEYLTNRTRFPNVSKKQKKEILETRDFLWGYAMANNLGPSKVDVLVLAYSKELAIPAVTDDKPMRNLAKAFGIKTMSTLGLLKLMLDEKSIDMAKVRSIVGFWMEAGDYPGDFSAEYRRLFGEPLP